MSPEQRAQQAVATYGPACEQKGSTVNRDVNGDGFDDLIIGAYSADASGNAKPNAGDSFVIFDNAARFGDVDLAALTPAQGFQIFGSDAFDSMGFSVSAGGDVNGDGFDDLIMGARSADGIGNAKVDAGESYVI